MARQKDSAITTVDTTKGDAISTKVTGDLNQPRWYSTGVLLPTGDVMAFSGADRDEVATPGTEIPVKQAEHSSSWMSGLVERVWKVFPQEHFTVATTYSGWIPCFITIPSTLLYSAVDLWGPHE